MPVLWPPPGVSLVSAVREKRQQMGWVWNTVRLCPGAHVDKQTRPLTFYTARTEDVEGVLCRPRWQARFCLIAFPQQL